MKIVFCFALILTTMNVSAQELNKKIHDEAHNREILINTCSREGMTSFPEFKVMFDPLYASYLPDSTTITQIKPLLDKTHIKIVFGTWCGDSKVYVPHFFKILDAAAYGEKNVDIIAVDGNKKAENGLVDSLDIQRVPTFIVYNDNNKELGRIVEHPNTTLEADLLEILNTKKQ
ncbi:thiol-disulfide isomerase/thioredoxin [Pedobacter sp. UYP30]|uniref:TlpA family protein disulfide reductase n=1 Tax=Pedobacter sp. UYP30 TaxID=1756400 RepID=UPI0033938961